MVKFNRKNQIEYGILALFFSFLMFGTFNNIEASSDLSGAQRQVHFNMEQVIGPEGFDDINNNVTTTNAGFEEEETEAEEVNLDQTPRISLWSRIRSGIASAWNASVRFFRWLFGSEVTTAVVVEEEEEDMSDKDQNDNTISHIVEKLSDNEDLSIVSEEQIEEEETDESSNDAPGTGEMRRLSTDNASLVEEGIQQLTPEVNNIQELSISDTDENNIGEEEEDI